MQRHNVIAPGYSRTTTYDHDSAYSYIGDSTFTIFQQLLKHNLKEFATILLIMAVSLGVLFI